jgi:hypothetical protein|tara:strand:- start:156 stop:647 length:492 start_codon:yes stop_codon:yes gene_type:complete
MKKIKIKENELVDLIEKLVKENLSNGTGFDFGMVGTPTSKYKDLLEKDDIEEEDELEESNGEEEQLNVNVTDQPGSDNEDEWMESISESKLVKRLTRKLHESEGKGCAESDGGSGCIKKGSYTDSSGKKYPWHILNNKKGGIWRGCTSKKDCESILDAFHANS